MGEQEGLPTAKRLRDLLVDHFTNFAPEVLKTGLDINGIVLWTMRNGLDALNRVLVAQTSQELDLNKNLGNANKRIKKMSAAFLGGQTNNEQAKRVLMSKLHSFYMQHDPEKLNNIHKIVRYGLLHGEQALSDKLRKKYGEGLLSEPVDMKQFNVINKTLNNVPVGGGKQLSPMDRKYKKREVKLDPNANKKLNRETNKYKHKTASESINIFLSDSVQLNTDMIFSDFESVEDSDIPSSNQGKKRRKKKKRRKNLAPPKQHEDEEFASLYGADSEKWDEEPPPIPPKRIMRQESDESFQSYPLKSRSTRSVIKPSKPVGAGLTWDDPDYTRAEVLAQFKEFFEYHDKRNLANDVLQEFMKMYLSLGREEMNNKLENLYHATLDQLSQNPIRDTASIVESEAFSVFNDGDSMIGDLMDDFPRRSMASSRDFKNPKIKALTAKAKKKRHVSVKIEPKVGVRNKLHFSLSPNAFKKGAEGWNSIVEKAANSTGACDNYRLDMLGKTSGICVCGVVRGAHSKVALYGPGGVNTWKHRFKEKVPVNANSKPLPKFNPFDKPKPKKEVVNKSQPEKKQPPASDAKAGQQRKNTFKFKFMNPAARMKDFTKNNVPHISVRNPNMILEKSSDQKGKPKPRTGNVYRRVSMKATKTPIGEPCNNYRLDINGKFHGDCKCGFSKLAHGMEFEQDRKNSKYMKELNEKKQHLARKREKGLNYHDSLKYNFKQSSSFGSAGSFRNLRSKKKKKLRGDSDMMSIQSMEKTDFGSFDALSQLSRPSPPKKQMTLPKQQNTYTKQVSLPKENNSSNGNKYALPKKNTHFVKQSSFPKSPSNQSNNQKKKATLTKNQSNKKHLLPKTQSNLTTTQSAPTSRIARMREKFEPNN